MTPLRVAAVSRNYFNMPLWVAQHRGFFAREGLAVELQLIEAIDEVTRRCAAGEVELELGVTENVVLDRERGGDLVVVGGNVNRLPFSLIAKPGIGSIADLRGKRIGVSSVEAGSSSLIMRLLAEHGLHHPADYEILAVGPILARWEKLLSGEIDAGLQGSPMNAVAIERGYVDLGSPRERFPDFQFTSLDVRRAWAKANRETLLAFLRAFLSAHRWLAQNREGSRPIAVAETGLSERHADLAWDEMVPGGIFPTDGRASLSAIQTLIEVSGQIRALPDRRGRMAADYVDHGFIQEAERTSASGSLGLKPARAGPSETSSMPRRNTLLVLSGAALAIALVVALSMLPVQAWLLSLDGKLRAYGFVTGMVAFGAIYVLCAMALVPASALSLAAGLIFGPVGIVLSWVAMVVAAAISLPLARRALARPVRRYVNERPRIRTVVEVIDEGGWQMVLLIRVSGVIPFGLQNYVLGITKVPFVPYLLASSVGFLPSILVYAGTGALGSAATGQAEGGPLRLALLGLAILAGLTLVVVTARKFGPE